MNKEQKLIYKYLSPLAQNDESLKLENDAAIINLKKKMIVSSDMMVEDTHFTKSYDPEILGKKLLRINLSDIAAMGASPYGFTLNISIPKINHEEWLKRFCLGLKKDMKKFNLKLFGGDLSGSSKIFLSITIFGLTKKKFHVKKNINNDSEIYLSGPVGDAGIGLILQKKNNRFKFLDKVNKNYFLNSLYYPEPEIKLGKSLIGIADFCTDVSDGLANELDFISKVSKFQSNIFLSEIPLSSQMKKILPKFKNEIEFWHQVLTSGEDYQLLFSVSKKKSFY